MPSAVTDSTCLIALDRIHQLEVLPAVFPKVIAPPAVQAEFSRTLAWLEVRSISNQRLLTSLLTQLQGGEAEAIVLATEVRAEAIVLDDRKARHIARELGLRPIGTVGLILRAKQRGIMPACKPLLDALVAAGFRLSESLYQEALRLAGEGEEG